MRAARIGNLRLRRGSVSKFALIALASVVALLILFYLALSLRPDSKRVSDATVVRMYCASSLVEPISRLIERFERDTGQEIELVRSGGSGELAGQLETEFEFGVARGADLYVTADGVLLCHLMEQGVVTERFSLAGQKPVIAVAAESQLSFENLVELLQTTDVRFGVASQRAAIGQAVRGIAKQHQVEDVLERKKMIDSENVMVLAQALVAGSLDAAVIWDTTVTQINSVNAIRGNCLKVAGLADPADLSQSEIAIGIVQGTKVSTTCLEFCRYLTSDAAKQTFDEYGFSASAEEHRGLAN